MDIDKGKEIGLCLWSYCNTLAGVMMLLSIGATQILKTWHTRNEKELSSGKMKTISAAITVVGFYVVGGMAGYTVAELRTPANVINVLLAAIAGPYVAQVIKWAAFKYLKIDLNELGRADDRDDLPPPMAPAA